MIIGTKKKKANSKFIFFPAYEEWIIFPRLMKLTVLFSSSIVHNLSMLVYLKILGQTRPLWHTSNRIISIIGFQLVQYNFVPAWCNLWDFAYSFFFFILEICVKTFVGSLLVTRDNKLLLLELLYEISLLP